MELQRFLDLFISINCSTCFRLFLRPSSGAQNCTYNVRYCQTNTAACWYRGWDRSQFHLIHDGSSIGLTIPDVVCTVLCSWWWAEKPPETCRAIYRNKQIEKTLDLVGFTLENVSFQWFTDISVSRLLKLVFIRLQKMTRTFRWVTSWRKIKSGIRLLKHAFGIAIHFSCALSWHYLPKMVSQCPNARSNLFK
jgi:hypothetical protein